MSRESYQTLCETLINATFPRFQSTKIPHRFRHIETDIDVDIVPFGAIGEPDKQIIWADSGNPMSILGFEEALSHATTTNIDDLEIQVIDIPSFVVLKVFAWGDRGESTNKDLEDIEFILSKYEDDGLNRSNYAQLISKCQQIRDRNLKLSKFLAQSSKRCYCNIRYKISNISITTGKE